MPISQIFGPPPPSLLPHSRNLSIRTIVIFWIPLSCVSSFMNGPLARQAGHSGRGEERVFIRKLKCQKFFEVIYPSIPLLCSALGRLCARKDARVYKISDCAFKEMNGGSGAGMGRSHWFRTIWFPSFSIPSGLWPAAAARCSGCHAAIPQYRQP